MAADRTMFPVGIPRIDDHNVTVDLMLKEPTRIDAYVSQSLSRDNLALSLYNNTSVTGGAMIFTQTTKSNLFPTDGPGIVAPGSEFPIIHTEDGAPQVVTVQKTGGKFGVTDEAVRRNDGTLLNNKARQVANVMRRELDRSAIGALKAALTGIDGVLEVASGGWVKATKQARNTVTPTTGEGQVAADLLEAIEKIESLNLGYKLDTLLVHPTNATKLKLLFGVGATAGVLREYGLSMLTSTEVPVSEAIVLQSKTVGTMGIEDALKSETWRDPATQTTWVQTWATVGFAVTDPLAMVKITGINT